MSKIREKLLSGGVRNLKEFGYPNADEQNILTDSVYSSFFKSMLKENMGLGGGTVDAEIAKLIEEIDSYDR